MVLAEKRSSWREPSRKKGANNIFPATRECSLEMFLCLEKEVSRRTALVEVFADHLHTNIARRPFLAVELDRAQSLKVRQVFPKLLSREPFLLMARIDVPEALRDLPCRLRRLTDPDNLNICLSRRQYVEDLLLRQPRLRQAKTHSTRSLRGTHLRPVLSMPHE